MLFIVFFTAILFIQQHGCRDVAAATGEVELNVMKFYKNVSVLFKV
jgi:hypothetical protein